MHIVAALGSIALIVIILWDAFEVVILPRRVTRKFRLARLFYRGTWRPWSWAVRRVSASSKRELYLSFYGPVSLVFLLSIWAGGLVLGFACLNRSIGQRDFLTDFYFSGSTLFTLGLGDVLPENR